MNFTSLIQALPAPLRHAAIVFVGASVMVLGKAVLAAGGVLAVEWLPVLVQAVNDGSVAAVGGVLLAWVSPLTSAYGYTSLGHEAVPEDVPEDVQD